MIGGSDHFILYDNPKALYDVMGDLPAGEKWRVVSVVPGALLRKWYLENKSGC